MRTVADRIRERLVELNWSESELARRAGVSQQTVNAIMLRHTKKPTSGPQIALALGVTTDWLMTESGPKFLPSPQNDTIATASGPVTVAFSGRRLPVFGVAMGGDGDEFLLNGERLNDALCPPALEHVRDAYCVYMQGDSMLDRYEPGETLFINPVIPARPGDYVVVQLRARHEGGSPIGIVKRFRKRTPTRLIVEQLNPPKELQFPHDEVVSVHVIVLAGRG